MDNPKENLAEICPDVEISSGFADSEWADFVRSETTSTSAHLIEWRKLISNVFGYEPLYRVARREGQISGVLPAFLVNSLLLGRHIISVPFLNSGGICASDEPTMAALVADAYQLVGRRRAKHLEMRCAYPPPDGTPAREHKVRIVLDLPGSADRLWDSLRGEIRNRTRRAQNAGLTVDFNSSELDGFYAVFTENMRDLGVPAHPKRFFEAVLSTFAGSSEHLHSVEEHPERVEEHPEPVEGRSETAERRSELVVVKAGSEVIGGAILFRFRDTIEVPWISCSRPHFELCPNNILYWEIMRRACEEGFRTFDFGRSSRDTGPATFKMRWGARVEQLYWHYALPDGASMPRETGVSNPRFQLASNLWKRTPQAVTDCVGPRLIRHLPG